MRIGVYLPQTTPVSMRHYVEQIVDHSPPAEIEWNFFHENDAIPDVDILWDPRLGGGAPPYWARRTRVIPLIVTLHGIKWKTRWLWDTHRGFRRLYLISKLAYMRLWWQLLRRRIDHIITISDDSQNLIVDLLPFESQDVSRIYHGVNHKLFVPASELSPTDNTPYFLHISVANSIKNVGRLVEAYQKIELPQKPHLRLVVAGYEGEIVQHPGIEWITNLQSHEALVKQYQQATAFLLPSFAESFGMPILEAMACGCPVITSNTSACKEIGADAALLIDPYSVESMKVAMERIIQEPELREQLRQQGLIRAQQFNWEATAAAHLRLFQQVLQTTTM